MLKDFLRYLAIDTQSSHKTGTVPSTNGQLELAKIVAEDLKDAGAKGVELTEDGFLYAWIEDNIPDDDPIKGRVPTIGFLAHFDTAGELSGADVKPQIIKNYDGSVINYPNNKNLKLEPDADPKLRDCVGHTIVTTDGTTLLGADDKSGIAILVELCRYYRDNPDDLHGTVRIGIIPDEEIGVGTEKLDLDLFAADFAYTIDGGHLGEIDVESFNGYKGTISVRGNVAFPGYGKGIYLSAIQVLSKIIAMMDEKLWPQNAEEREGIWWIQSISGSVEKADAEIYLRDFELEGINTKIDRLEEIKKHVLSEYPKSEINIEIKEQYKNYRFNLEKDERVVSFAEDAMKRAGIKPNRKYLRGGNDSCHLCEKGLLSTNLFAGSENPHSLKEWASIEVMEAALKTVIELVEQWTVHSEK